MKICSPLLPVEVFVKALTSLAERLDDNLEVTCQLVHTNVNNHEESMRVTEQVWLLVVSVRRGKPRRTHSDKQQIILLHTGIPQNPLHDPRSRSFLLLIDLSIFPVLSKWFAMSVKTARSNILFHSFKPFFFIGIRFSPQRLFHRLPTWFTWYTINVLHHTSRGRS